MVTLPSTLLWGLLLAVPSASAPAEQASSPRAEALGIAVPGQSREMTCRLLRPPGAGRFDRPALLIVLHGTDDTAEDALAFWSARRHELPLLLVAPQGVGKGWCDEDVPALRAMLDELRRRAPFDENRVLIAGFSAGGAMAMHLLYAEAWPCCAVAALANYVPPPITRDQIVPRRLIPVFYAVGMADINADKMRVGLDLLRSAGANIDLYRPSIGHTLDPQVGQAAVDWLLLRARRQVTARIDAWKDRTTPDAADGLAEIIEQERWHERANVDAAQRALARIEQGTREKLQEVERALEAGRPVEALETLAAIEPGCPSQRLRAQVARKRAGILQNPAVEKQWAEHQKERRSVEAMQIYAGAQRSVAERRYPEALNRCRRVLRDYGDTPAARRAGFLIELLKMNGLVEDREPATSASPR